MDIEVQTFVGKAAAAYIDILADLRIRVFRAFPYLYEGSHSYEESYLQHYIDADCSAVVIAFADGKPVGAATCMALIEAFEEVRAPFEAQALDLSAYCYFGESVLLPAFRSRGIGHSFFGYREQFALQYSNFKYATFCAVARPDSHFLCPKDYRDLSEFWQKRGYQKQANLRAMMSWQDIGEDKETAKPMDFWQKKLRS